MPAGPAPTIARSAIARSAVMRQVEMAPAALAADAHAGSDGDHAALPVRHAVDLGEAIEAHAHHAIGRALAAADRRVADRRTGRRAAPRRRPRRPAARSTVRPSTSTAIVAARPRQAAAGTSKRFAENGAMHRVERAGGDHRREQIGVRPGQGDAAVAIRGKGAGEALGFVVDRQPVRRHDAQRRPGAHDLQFREPRKGPARRGRRSSASPPGSGRCRSRPPPRCCRA